MSTDIPVSVLISAEYGEEDLLQDLLLKLVDFPEIVLMEGAGCKNIREVAERFSNVRMLSSEESRGLGCARLPALAHEWVLMLRANEELSWDYLQEMKLLLSTGEYDALESPLTVLRWGRRPRTFIRSERAVRLFRKDPAFRAAGGTARVRRVRAEIFKHEDLSFSERLKRSHGNGLAQAERMFTENRRCTWLHLLCAFPVAFLRSYLLHGNFLEGMPGFLISMDKAYRAFMTYALLWERRHPRKRVYRVLAIRQVPSFFSRRV